MNTIGRDGVILIILYLVIKDLVIPLVRYVLARRNGTQKTGSLNLMTNTNTGCRPGYGSTCKEHGKDIEKIEKDLKFLSRDLNQLIAKSEENCKHNDAEHERIFKAIEKIRNGL